MTFIMNSVEEEPSRGPPPRPVIASSAMKNVNSFDDWIKICLELPKLGHADANELDPMTTSLDRLQLKRHYAYAIMQTRKKKRRIADPLSKDRSFRTLVL